MVCNVAAVIQNSTKFRCWKRQTGFGDNQSNKQTKDMYDLRFKLSSVFNILRWKINFCKTILQNANLPEHTIRDCYGWCYDICSIEMNVWMFFFLYFFVVVVIFALIHSARALLMLMFQFHVDQWIVYVSRFLWFNNLFPKNEKPHTMSND